VSRINKPESTFRILRAAEELFSIYGYHGTSLRDITQKAKVNLAAVNYHFDGKESLFRAVVAARLQPINEIRIANLERAQQTSPGGLVPLSVILDAFARPLFELGLDHTNGGHHFARIIGRSITLSLPFVHELLANDLHPVTIRFAQAIRRHAANLSPEDFLWRLNFVVGAMHHTLATSHQMKELTRGICHGNDPEEILGRFIHFAVTSLTAPLSVPRH
jgi:AcrR family transcriptional regulator